MSRTGSGRLRTGLTTTAIALFVTGCASFDIDRTLATTNEELGTYTRGELELARTDEQRKARADKAAGLLSDTLDRDGAVQLALVNSPALQAMIADNWAEGADAAQAGRIPNPVFAFERLVTSDASALELDRTLSIGLLDILTLPWRKRAADRRIELARVALASEVVGRVTDVRRAWVEAVAAAQDLQYAEQVRESAASAAEMARRLESAGNYSRLERTREQVFYAETTAQLAATRHEARAARENLVRLLGLSEIQAGVLTLPEQLPDLPEEPMGPAAIGEGLNERRLDVRLAKSELDAAGRAQGLGNLTTFTDIEVGYRSNTVFAEAGQPVDGPGINKESADGYEIAVQIPLFDWGGAQRDALNARSLAAANRYTDTLRAVSSNLRESYSAYRTSYDIASFYGEEILPLRELISEENVMQYNGMLISVFELLADSRSSIGAVQAAIDAQRQFWLADAALQATLTGRPSMTAVASMGAAAAGGEDH